MNFIYQDKELVISNFFSQNRIFVFVTGVILSHICIVKGRKQNGGTKKAG